MNIHFRLVFLYNFQCIWFSIKAKEVFCMKESLPNENRFSLNVVSFIYV